jgi:hypothetical protein
MCKRPEFSTGKYFKEKFVIFMKLLQKPICAAHLFMCRMIVLPDPLAVMLIALPYAGAIIVNSDHAYSRG